MYICISRQIAHTQTQGIQKLKQCLAKINQNMKNMKIKNNTLIKKHQDTLSQIGPKTSTNRVVQILFK